MSATVKLSSKLPGDPEVNGLDAWRGTLEDDPDRLIVCVAYIDCAKVTIDTDTGAHVPTARVRRIEPLGVVGDVSQAVRDAVAAAEEERTGRSAIPFGVVDAGEYAHGDPLPEDGDK